MRVITLTGLPNAGGISGSSVRLAAYSCGGSSGLTAAALPFDRIPFYPEREGSGT